MKYNDLSYIDKRKILRQYYTNDKDAHRVVKTLAFAVKEKLTNPFMSQLMDYDIIIDYLIDGYLAFEINNNRLIQLDPCNLECAWSSENGIHWKQITSDKILPKDKVLYISYYLYETSFLSSIYKGLINSTDEKFILCHVDYVIDKLSNNVLDYEKILKIDKLLLRSIKVKKLKENYEQY